MELNNFFRTIYGWFITYSDGLYNYLAGYDCQMDSTRNNLFDGSIGWWTLGVVFLFIILFYFVRHTSFSGLLHWFITLGLVAVISWLIGWGIASGEDGNILDCHRYGNTDGQIEISTVENNEITDGGIEDEYSDLEENNVIEPIGDIAGDITDMIPVITEKSYVAFGFSNMIVAIIEFIIISFIVKRFSIDCRHTPWRSLWPKH